MGIQWDCEVIAHDMTASVCELRLPSFFSKESGQWDDPPSMAG
jgi:hypothetical protein